MVFELDRSNPSITDAGLETLPSRPAWDWLNLTNTHTTDEGSYARQQTRPNSSACMGVTFKNF